MENHNKGKKKFFKAQDEPIRYWMVELTLTSGRVHKFYVKAKTEFDAYEIAEGWSFLADLPELQSDTFRLRHSTDSVD